MRFVAPSATDWPRDHNSFFAAGEPFFVVHQSRCVAASKPMPFNTTGGENVDSEEPPGRTRAVSAGARRALRVVTTVVVVAVLITIGLSVRANDHRSNNPRAVAGQPVATPGVTAPAAAPPVGPAEVPLVTKMLDELRAGKKVTSEDDPLAGAPIQAVSTKAGVTSSIGRIRIPRLDVDQKLFNGVDDAALLGGPGHWPGTPLPGQKGNAVISGHRGTHTKPFLRVNLLDAGDKVIVTAGGATTTYAVQRVVIVSQSKYVPFVLKQPTDSKAELLTLFACNPLTSHEQRIVVQAKAVH
jgi:sortase A